MATKSQKLKDPSKEYEERCLANIKQAVAFSRGKIRVAFPKKFNWSKHILPYDLFMLNFTEI